jgi:hypothetical protein
MNARDSFEIYSKVCERINQLWKYTVWVQVIVIGWIILMSSIEGLNMVDEIRIIIFVIYLLGDAFIPYILVKEHHFLNVIRNQLKYNIQNEPDITDDLKQTIVNLKLRYRISFIWISHAIMAVIIALLLWGKIVAF